MKNSTKIKIAVGALSALICSNILFASPPSLPVDYKGVAKFVSGQWRLDTQGTWARYSEGQWVNSGLAPQTDEIVLWEPASGNLTNSTGGTLTVAGFYSQKSTGSAATSTEFSLAASNLTINGNLVATNSTLYKSTVTLRTYADAALTVNGSVYVGDVGYIGETSLALGRNDKPLSSIDIASDVYIRSDNAAGGSRNYISFNAGNKTYTESPDISSADIKIGGAIHLDGDYRTYVLGMTNNTSTNRVCVFSVGGFDGAFSFCLSNSSASKNLLVLNLTQSDSFTLNDKAGNSISETGIDAFGESSKIRLSMTGTGVQRLEAGSLYFSGGVQMLSGTLLVNGRAKGSSDTTFTHGKLEMNGGTFGIYQNSGGSGTFTFGDGSWFDGVISLGTYDDGVDTLQFTGKFTKEEGAQRVVFHFDGDCTYLQNQTMIVDCTNLEGFTEDDFYASNKTIWGTECFAQFKIRNDGLYVQYIAVPESAAFASIFGMFALGFAYVRRRG